MEGNIPYTMDAEDAADRERLAAESKARGAAATGACSMPGCLMHTLLANPASARDVVLDAVKNVVAASKGELTNGEPSYASMCRVADEFVEVIDMTDPYVAMHALFMFASQLPAFMKLIQVTSCRGDSEHWRVYALFIRELMNATLPVSSYPNHVSATMHMQFVPLMAFHAYNDPSPDFLIANQFCQVRRWECAPHNTAK